jgi:hypothetical protein
MDTLLQLVRRIDAVNTEEHHQTRAKVFDEQVSHRAEPGGIKEIRARFEMLDVSEAQETALRRKVQQDILETLIYPAMTERYEDIVEAFPETFEWAFKNSTSEQLQWSNLSEWLKKESGIYWISGKAGSGKSTLMKHIFDDVRTRQYLADWAKEGVCGEQSHLQIPLCIATFFFWNSGTPEQKSQSGCLRALIYQVLSSHPELISVVFPEMWAKRYSDSIEGLSHSFNHALTVRRLTSAFRKLTQQTVVPLKLCFFVDGLDEFYGDQEELASLFKLATTTSPTVKICLSSRPWVIFEQIYGASPSLRLQDLTHRDIEHYVTSKFNRNPAFGRVEASDPSAAALLRDEVIEKAEGVFLWVVIVVKSLLLGIGNQDDVIILRQRLMAMPKELEGLYDHLLNLIEPVYLVWASKAFQILRAVREICSDESAGSVKRPEGSTPLTVSTFFFAITENIQFHIDTSNTICLIQNVSPTTTQRLTPESFPAKCVDIKIHLTARCAGLLEVPRFEQKGTEAPIQFLHRTAKDFLYNSDKWRQMLSHTENVVFDPHRSMLLGSVLDVAIKTAVHATSSEEIYRAVTNAMLFARHTNINQIPNESETSVLDNLDHIMTGWSPTRVGAMGGQLTKNVHWTDRLIVEHTRKLRADMAFLKLATVYGLANYVGESLGELGRTTAAHVASQLLLILLPSNPWPRELRPPLERPEMVSTLLHHGANPNFSNGKFPTLNSPWLNTLLYCKNEDHYTHRLNDSFIRIMKLLAEAGADPKVYVGYQFDDSVSATAIVEKYIVPKFPREGRDLLDALGRKKSIKKVKKLEQDESDPASRKRGLYRKIAALSSRLSP